MKIKRTFTIDNIEWKKFDLISKELSMNKSLFIENCIKKLIKDNDNSKDNKIQSK